MLSPSKSRKKIPWNFNSRVPWPDHRVSSAPLPRLRSRCPRDRPPPGPASRRQGPTPHGANKVPESHGISGCFMGTKGKKPINVTYFMISIIFDIYIYILYIYLEMQLPHFYAKRQFFPCYGVIPGATSWSFFGLRHFHWYVWTTLGLKGKDVHLNWCDVLEPGFVFLKKCFFPEKTTGNITKSFRPNSQTLRRNFRTITA